MHHPIPSVPCVAMCSSFPCYTISVSSVMLDSWQPCGWPFDFHETDFPDQVTKFKGSNGSQFKWSFYSHLPVKNKIATIKGYIWSVVVKSAQPVNPQHLIRNFTWKDYTAKSVDLEFIFRILLFFKTVENVYLWSYGMCIQCRLNCFKVVLFFSFFLCCVFC